MEIEKNQKAQSGMLKSILFMVSILAAAFFVQNSAKADLATPFVEMNNQVGDISEAHGWVVTLGSKLEDSKYFYVIVNTDTMDQVVIGATAEKGVVKESLLGRWVIIKAQVTSLSDAPRLTHANIQLKILSVKSAEPVNEKPTEVQAKAISSDMEKFIKFRAIDSGMPYDSLKKTIKKDQLPLLYELLAEPEYAPYWNSIARIIGYISDDPNSINVLLMYFQRDDISRIDSIAGKVGSLAWIGKIGGEKADSILKKAVSKEGARELAKFWIDKEEWKKGNEKRDKNQIITYIQGAAIDGLVYSGKKQNWDIVDRLYNDTSQEDIRSKLVEAMAKKAYITDHNNDVESYFRIDSQTIYKSLKKYLDEYDPVSEVVIRKSVAIQLNKDPNELTDADFVEITKLNIDNTHISNLEPIKRLKNLRELSAYNNPISDIEPLRELVNLQKLVLNSTQVTNLEPLRDLELYLSKTPVSNLRPLRELTNLQKLFIQLCNNLPYQQVQELQKALPELKIQRAGLR